MSSLTRVGAPPVRMEFVRLLRENLWAVAAGAWVGLLGGGVGGRLAMLVLRLTSPESVHGIESDDGFVVGQVSLATFNLLLACTFIGAVAGAGYWLFRSVVVHRRIRLVSWSLFCGLLGGAVLVKDKGVDFGLLEPIALAVALFIVIPLAAAAAMSLLADRWIASPAPLRSPAGVFRVLPAAVALAVPVPLALALAGSGAWAVMGRLPARVRSGVRVAGMSLAAVIAALSASDLGQDITSLGDL